MLTPVSPFCSSFQLVGLQALGFSHGFERLHYLLESAWDGDHISHKFMKASRRAPFRHYALSRG